VQTLDDATELLDRAADAWSEAGERRPTVSFVGTGYGALGLAEAFSQRGAAVTIFEPGREVMDGPAGFDPDMGALVARAFREQGVPIELGASAAQALDADLVILGLGPVPNTELGVEAGLPTGSVGGYVVDRQQQAAEGVWAAGDCCESVHLVSGRPAHHPFGTVANKQGRVAGINISGGYATFPGVLGTLAGRAYETEFARTGLTEAEAAAAGFDFESSTIKSFTAPRYMGDSPQVTVKIVAERGSGRLLGGQIVGGAGAGRRIDVVASALAGRLGVEDLAALDLGYAPSLSTVWDPFQVASRQLISRR
jgi:NADPH-dependent 2,4-dienoyl-CoA reductase/sulfur reductase-like enzyme